jgi:RHS repeat-associated protein
VPLHEWQTTENEPLIDIVTWVFEEGTFVPTARIIGNDTQSIVTDYLGTPMQMYDANGAKTWEVDLDIYGRVRTFAARSLSDCPFRYQGQYQDEETGLYYNRFRYYDPYAGNYLSQDPIGLAGGDKLYAYVHDVNRWVDIWGLLVVEGQVGTYGDLMDASSPFDGFQIHHIPQDKLGYLPRNEGIAVIMTDADHAKTRTFKTKGRITAAIDKDRAFKDVLKDDLIDLHKIGGGKFDNSIEQIIKRV